MVIRILDGATIAVEIKDESRTVRSIGVDTRECFASQAAERNRELVNAKATTLKKDVSATDQRGRLPRISI